MPVPVIVAALAESLITCCALPLLVFPARRALHPFVVAILQKCKRSKAGAAMPLQLFASSQSLIVSGQPQAEIAPRRNSYHEARLYGTSVNSSPPESSPPEPLLSSNQREVDEESQSSIAGHTDSGRSVSTNSEPTNDEYHLISEAEQEADQSDPPLAVRLAESFAISAACFALAAVVPDVSVVTGLLGSSLAAVVCYVLPAIYYLKATNDSGRQRPPRRVGLTPLPNPFIIGRVSTWRRALGWFLLAYGIVIMVLGTIITVMKIAKGQE